MASLRRRAGHTGALLGFLGFTGTVSGSVIKAVRWLRGRKVASKVVLEDGNIKLETGDGDAFVVPQAVAKLVDDPQVRQPLERFTEPLREEGVDAIKFEGGAGEQTERIVADEAQAFKATAGIAPTSQSRFQATYQIKRLYFDEGRKWRLSSGSQAIQAEIADQAFWARIGNS
ncbi:MAG TPA: hypothetical protein VJ846_12715, partial [Sphingomicrobium sp.]|nr:hypothetical protein [Sphingomicrobium sp.]